MIDPDVVGPDGLQGSPGLPGQPGSRGPDGIPGHIGERLLKKSSDLNCQKLESLRKLYARHQLLQRIQLSSMQCQGN